MTTLRIADAWEVVDVQTGAVMSRHSDSKRAYRKADRLDLAYGACRYMVQRVTLLESAGVAS